MRHAPRIKLMSLFVVSTLHWCSLFGNRTWKCRRFLKIRRGNIPLVFDYANAASCAISFYNRSAHRCRHRYILPFPCKQYIPTMRAYCRCCSLRGGGFRG
ncbi:hypothetical protein HD806DRAFT_297494 [Xylariaceae sp. AK1471]|nr:hypothetical protein HD806DRAFT_297494 [Xylariaceae sp. AK1471]